MNNKQLLLPLYTRREQYFLIHFSQSRELCVVYNYYLKLDLKSRQ